jgi:hypothetical protein
VVVLTRSWPVVVLTMAPASGSACNAVRGSACSFGRCSLTHLNCISNLMLRSRSKRSSQHRQPLCVAEIRLAPMAFATTCVAELKHALAQTNAVRLNTGCMFSYTKARDRNRVVVCDGCMASFACTRVALMADRSLHTRGALHTGGRSCESRRCGRGAEAACSALESPSWSVRRTSGAA